MPRRFGRSWRQDREIESFFLPGDSPELNPDEYPDADLKARMNAAEPVKERGVSRRKAASHLRSIQKQPARAGPYFKAKNIG
jgi:hypothetical protein